MDKIKATDYQALTFKDVDGWVSITKEFGGLSGVGDTPEESIKALYEVLDFAITDEEVSSWGEIPKPQNHLCYFGQEEYCEEMEERK